MIISVTRSQRISLAVVIWLLAIALAATVDRPIALWRRDSGCAAWLIAHHALQATWKAPGEFEFTLAVIFVALFIPPKEKIGRPRLPGERLVQYNWRASAFILIAASISGLNGLIKWMVGRTRPFKLPDFDAMGHAIAEPFVLHPFRAGWHGLFNGKNLCFPSGHSALAVSTAAALAILWPRCRWAAYAVATLVVI